MEQTLFWSLPIRLTIESYTITLVCALINLEHVDFNGTLFVQLNSYVTVFCLLWLTLFPICAHVFMMCNQKQLADKEGKYGELWAELKVSRSTTQYVFYTFFRRALLAFAVVVLRNDFTF